MADYNYYAAPEAQLGPGMNSSPFVGQVVLASRGQRFIAYMIDSFIMLLAAIPAIIGLVFSFMGSSLAFMLGMMGFGAITFAIVAMNIYYLATNGQTIGKKLQGIKIVRSDLVTTASFWRIVLFRFLPIAVAAWIVPFVGWAIQLGNYLMIFGEEQRCGHDLIADTHVVVDRGTSGVGSGEFSSSSSSAAGGGFSSSSSSSAGGFSSSSADGGSSGGGGYSDIGF